MLLAGLLEKVGVDIHPDPDAPATAYGGIQFEGLGLLTEEQREPPGPKTYLPGLFAKVPLRWILPWLLPREARYDELLRWFPLPASRHPPCNSIVFMKPAPLFRLISAFVFHCPETS